MANKSLPSELRQRVRSYVDRTRQQKLFDEPNLLRGLNRSIREDILMHSLEETIRGVPILNSLDRGVLVYIVSKLQQEHYGPGDFLIQQGDVGEECFFLSKGTVMIKINEAYVTSLGPGSHFGEMALLKEHADRRVASVVAREAVEVYVLKRKDFLELLSIE